MRVATTLFLAIFAFATLTLAKSKPSAKTAYCIANDDAQYICTNTCKLGATCVAKCKGQSRKIKVKPKTGRVTWADGNNKNAKGLHIIQDEHECTNYPEAPKHQPQCAKTTKYFKNKGCINMDTGITRRPGWKGVN